MGKFGHRSALAATLAAIAVASSPSGAAADTADLAPAAPTNLEVDPSETEVFVKWSRGDGAALAGSYEVVRGQSLVAATTSLVASDGGLAPDSTYCYSVVAIDADGRRSPPAGPACVRTLDVTPPTSPSAVAISLVSPVEVALSWEAATDNAGVAGYEVVRGERVVARTESVEGRESSLKPGRHYCYSVRAFDRVGNRSPPSPAACVETPDVTPPSVPSRVAAAPGPRQVALSWAESTDDVGVAGYEVLSGDQVVATSATPTGAPGGLAAGEHCFAVRAFDKAGNRSASSEPVCAVVPDTTPPSVPEGLLASAPGETSSIVRWNPSTDDVGVAGYELLRGEKVVARSVGTSAGEEELRPFQEYCYRVRAYDAAGNRSEPSPPSCVLTPDMTPPAVPGEPAAEAASDRSVRLRWKESTDNVRVQGYEVLRGGEVVATSEDLLAQETGLEPARDYCYTIRAFDQAGNRSGVSSPVCARTPDLTPPTVPSGVAAAGLTTSRIALAWQPSTDDVGVTGYEVLRGEAVVAKVANPRAELAGLSPATEYCFGVRALDAAGNVSNPSAPVCAKTGEPGSPPAPSYPTAEQAGPGLVVLRWTPSPAPDVVYTILWGKGERIGITRFASYRVSGLKPGDRRCYQILAVDGAGNASQKTWPVCAEVAATPPLSAR